MALQMLAASLPSRGCSLICSAPACYHGLVHTSCSSRTFSTSSQSYQEQPVASSTGELNQSTEASSSNGSSSSSSIPSRLGGVDPNGFELVYEGFFSRPHKRLKYASLLNTFASFAAAPLIIQYSTASPIARVAVTTSVIAFAVITTGGLHWFTKPYVHQLWYNKQQQEIKAQTMSLFGGVKWKQFPLSSVTEFGGIHPLANFKADGKTFYVDRGNFHDAELLMKLMPWSASQQTEATGATSDLSAQDQTDGKQQAGPPH